jgi:hypothetical protein
VHHLHRGLRRQLDLLYEDDRVVHTVFTTELQMYLMGHCASNAFRTRYRLWLPETRDASTDEALYDLDPAAILDKYSDGNEPDGTPDTGPQDAWFYNMAVATPPNLETGREFTFWSRQRWDILSQGRMPTMQHMVSDVSDDWTPLAEFPPGVNNI